jgi:hypothetical protein
MQVAPAYQITTIAFMFMEFYMYVYITKLTLPFINFCVSITEPPSFPTPSTNSCELGSH